MKLVLRKKELSNKHGARRLYRVALGCTRI